MRSEMDGQTMRIQFQRSWEQSHEIFLISSFIQEGGHLQKNKNRFHILGKTSQFSGFAVGIPSEVLKAIDACWANVVPMLQSKSGLVHSVCFYCVGVDQAHKLPEKVEGLVMVKFFVSRGQSDLYKSRSAAMLDLFGDNEKATISAIFWHQLGAWRLAEEDGEPFGDDDDDDDDGGTRATHTRHKITETRVALTFVIFSQLTF